jgi:hypothetical protein
MMAAVTMAVAMSAVRTPCRGESIAHRRPITVTGAAIHVYVIDTGIDFNHEDLNVDAAELGLHRRMRRKGGDDHGHGTHVAGTIGAIKNGLDVVGVAPDVTLHSVKVLDSTGYGLSPISSLHSTSWLVKWQPGAGRGQPEPGRLRQEVRHMFSLWFRERGPL